MRNFQKRITFMSFIESWPVLIILGLFLLFFAWGVWGFLGKMEMTRENKKLAEDKLVDLQKQKDNLSQNIDQLKTTEGKEASIREKFGLAKDGEGEIVVVDDTPTPVKTESSGFWGFIKSWFK